MCELPLAYHTPAGMSRPRRIPVFIKFRGVCSHFTLSSVYLNDLLKYYPPVYLRLRNPKPDAVRWQLHAADAGAAGEHLSVRARLSAKPLCPQDRTRTDWHPSANRSPPPSIANLLALQHPPDLQSP